MQNSYNDNTLEPPLGAKYQLFYLVESNDPTNGGRTNTRLGSIMASVKIVEIFECPYRDWRTRTSGNFEDVLAVSSFASKITQSIQHSILSLLQAQQCF